MGVSDYAQSFDTGSNTAGYNLDSIVLDFDAAATGTGTLTVTVRVDNSDSPSGTVLYTLTNPATFSSGLNEFTAPSNASLDMRKTYHVVASYSAATGGPRWWRTFLADGLDSGHAPGWNIDAAYRIDSRTNPDGWSVQSSSRAVQIQVKGSAVGATTNAAPTFTSGSTAAFDAAENTTAAGTVEATDADSGDDVTYEITGGADQAKFSIGSTSGALTFNTAPNYESPTDAASTTPSNAAGNNEYIVAVTATGGTGARAMTAVQTITVTVTNEEEAGTVALSAAQPVVGTALTATLTDPDGGETGTTWVWEKSADGQSGWSTITGATAASYTPVTGDVGSFLRATASYTDGHGSGKDAQAVSDAVLASAPVATKPAQVTGLTATANAARTGVVLAWTTPADGGSPITGHEYQRKGRTGSYGSWTAIATSAAGEANVAGFTVTGLTNSRNYTFKVRAVNAVDNGDASAEASAATVPDAGTLSLSSTESGRVRIRYSTPQNPADGGSRVTYWEYRYKKTADANFGGWSRIFSPQKNVRNLEDGVEYTFEVRPVNAIGTGAVSTRTITLVGLPDQVTGLTATADVANSQVVLAWTTPDGNGSAITKHQYRYRTRTTVDSAWFDIPMSAEGEANVASFTVTGLTEPKEYRFEVRAFNAEGEGDESASASAATKPGRVTGLTAEAGGPTAIDLSWTAPTDDGGDTIFDHKIEVCASNCTDDANWSRLDANRFLSATTYSHTGLTSGTTRSYRVSARNPVGTGPASAVATATTSTITLTVNPASVGEGAGTTTITVTATLNGSALKTATMVGVTVAGGTATVPDDFLAVTGFTITIPATDASAMGTFSLTPVDDSVDDDDETVAVSGTATDFVVNPATVTITDNDDAQTLTAPGTPRTLTATPGDGAVVLTWTAPTSGGTPSRYEHRHKATSSLPFVGSDSWTSAGTALTATVGTLTNGTPYSFEVRAVNSVGAGTAATESATPMEGICRRTAQVRDYLLGLIPMVDNCAVVTATHLAAFTGTSNGDLLLNNLGITSLKVGDFAGLGGVRGYVVLDGNSSLASLPSGVFEGLSGAVRLSIQNAALTLLTAGMFDGLDSVTELYLSGNPLTSLGPGVFDGLGDTLVDLVLSNNQLRELPDGVFEGLDGLTYLYLQGNPGALFALTLVPERVGDTNNVKVKVAEGAPFPMSATLTVSGGTVDGGTTVTVTVPAGATESDAIAVTPTGNTGTTVTLSGPSAVPSGTNFQGMATAVGDPLVLPAAATAPGAPRTPAAAPGDGEVVLTWTAPASTGGSAIQRYEHRHKATGSLPFVSSDSWTTAGTALTATVSGLTNDTPYSFEVRAVNTVGAGTAATTSATPTAAAMPTVSVKDATKDVSEKVGSVEVCAVLDAPSGRDTKVVVATADGTAIAGEDYTGGSIELSFEAGQTEQCVDILVTDDTDTEDAETFTVTLSLPADPLLTLGTDRVTTVTIGESDQPAAMPVVTLVLTPSTISENGGISRVTATISPALPSSVWVQVSAAAMSPATAADFRLGGQPLLHIPANATESSRSAPITARDNLVAAPDKTVTVSGTIFQRTDVTAPADVTLTITDNEAPCTASASASADAVWSSCVRVGQSGSGALVAYGYTKDIRGGLDDTGFSHGGTARTVKAIDNYRTSRPSNTLNLDVDPGFGRNGANLVLHVGGGKSFDLADAGYGFTGTLHSYSWHDTGLAWSAGDTVAVWLAPRGAAPAPVVNNVATGAPTILLGGAAIGTRAPEAEQSLTASLDGVVDADGMSKALNGDAGYAPAWQWIIDGTESDAPTDTGEIYVPRRGNVGSRVKVRVRFKDDAGNEETLTSAATAAVIHPTAPPTTVQPPAAGDCAPSVANAVWTACLTVDRRIDDESDYAQVGYDRVVSVIGELSDTGFERGGSDYTVKRLLWDSGVLRFRLSAGLGNVAGLTLHVGGAALALSGATARVDGVTGDGVYTWSRSDIDTEDETQTHKLGLTDGAAVPVVLAPTGTVADNHAAEGRPKIVAAAGGTAETVARVGTRLKVDYSEIEDDDGTTNAVWSHQWIGGRKGIDSGTGKIDPYRAIAGANSADATYTPTTDDLGKLLKVRVSFTDGAGHVEHRISWAVGPVVAGSAQQSNSQGATARPIAGFTLFDNAAGGADVQALTDGAALAALSSGRLNIRAEAAAEAKIGSVRMELSGAVASARTEGIAPYALFGDRGGRAFPAGTYTVTATAYPERDLGGTPGPATSVTFTVAGAAAAPSATVTSGATVPVSGEFAVTVRFSEPVTGFRMSELVIANGSAMRMLSVPDGTQHTVYVAPDAGASGEITITVPAGVAADADGNPNTASAAFAIAIASVWDPLTGFTLFDNAAGGADVQALSDGTVLRGLVSGQLNVRADTRSGAAIGSVRMALSGAMSSSRTEGIAPYALFGDRGGRAFAPGSYTVTATPYPERGLGGTAGKTRSVTFRVVLPALSVADARAEEGTDETIDFAVTLDAASRGRVTVDYATSDGTAKAGADYTAASGTLTFTAGETAKTVAVTVLDDAIDEGEETFTLTLSNPSGATIADGTATGTITNSDPLQKMWLSRFGRTVAGHVVDAVAGRLSGPSPGTQVTLGGQSIGLSGTGGDADAAAAALDTLAGARQAREAGDAWAGSGAWPETRAGSWGGAAEGGGPVARSMTGRELLLGSAFHLAGDGDAGGGPAWAAWGRVMAGGFDAKAPSDNGTVRMDGEVTTGILGADAAWDRWLAGVALSVSEGEGDYSLGGCAAPSRCRGTLESSLTAVHPYVRVDINDRVSAWGLFGYGTGDMTMTEDAVGNEPGTVTRTDIEMRLAAAGARGALLEADEAGGFDLALRGDAFLVQMEWEKVSNETDTRADASRLRLVLEGGRAFELGEGAVLTPGLELGLRHDGGDAETGTGVEAGASVRYADPESGLTVEASARRLLAHEDSGFGEWGVSGSVRLDPGASGRGLSLTLAPTVGAASSGVDRLWSARDAAGLAANDDFEAERRLEAEVGYGFGGPEGLGVVTPYAGLGLAGGDARTWRAGARWSIGPSFALRLDGSRREAANDDAPDHGLMLRGSLRW